MFKLKAGDIVKITTNFGSYLQDRFPQNLITEVNDPHSAGYGAVVKCLDLKFLHIHKSHLVRASEREAFHYHIYGPHISDED